DEPPRVGRSRRGRSNPIRCLVLASFCRVRLHLSRHGPRHSWRACRTLGMSREEPSPSSGNADRIGSNRLDLAAELVGSQVDVIVTGGTPATKAVKNATRTTPIVMPMVGDPVGAGLVENLGRPGGNATGLSIVATDLSGKRLQLLKEIVPGLSSIAVMSYGANPQTQMELRETQIAAQKLDLQVHSVND